MDNIQSNYPRAGSQRQSIDDLQRIQHSAKVGKVSVLFLIISNGYFAIPLFGSRKGEDNANGSSLLLEMLLAIGTVIFFVTAIWATMVWISCAHRAVCTTRGITSKVPSKFVGFASGIPYLLLYIPLIYALDFIVVRSESPDKPILQRYSLLSKSKLVNTFCMLLTIHVGCTIFVYGLKFFFNEPNNIVSYTFNWVGATFALLATLIGFKIASNVHRSLQALFDQEYPNSDPSPYSA